MAVCLERFSHFAQGPTRWSTIFVHPVTHLCSLKSISSVFKLLAKLR